MLLCAGAGGQTGWANPFAFVRALRRDYDGVIVLAGGLTDGRGLHAAIELGADYGYMGTCFVATREAWRPTRTSRWSWTANSTTSC
ncbi:MAG: nitronate monooxygenase [Burkholderiaceae bacterium]